MKDFPGRKITLLSPCGSYESLMAAIQAGCNAVYFGVEQLNMRARSSVNFTIDDLAEIKGVAAKNGIKAYLTLNTVMYDHDLNLMRSIVDAALKAGIDAVIASDHAVIAYAHKVGMPVHISTQANITNIETVEFYAAFADVMVLARELTLKQVSVIVREIQRRKITGPSGMLVGVEIFIHGALCMAISGKCYLSLHSHFASANRGACFQNCRRSYLVKDKDEGFEYQINNEYIMSAKDLCTIGFLDEVLDSGASVLKIEGRGRSEEYVYTATKCYREAIDAVANGTYSQTLVSQWTQKLETVFNRGFWDGYYLGRKMGEWSDAYGSKATEKKIYLGKGVKYFDKSGVGEFLIESRSVSVGDKVMISGPSTGVIFHDVSEIRIDNQTVPEAGKGSRISIPVSARIRPSDKLYKIVSSA